MSSTYFAAQIDISLVANDQFIPMIIRWFQTDQNLRVPACEVLQALISKGMDRDMRLKLIHEMGLVQLIAYVSSISPQAADEEHEFILGLSFPLNVVDAKDFVSAVVDLLSSKKI